MSKCRGHIPLLNFPNTPSFTHLWDQSVQVALQTQSVQAGQALLEGQFFLEVLPSQGDQEVLVCHGMLLPVQVVFEPGDRLTLLWREGNVFVRLEDRCFKTWRARNSGLVKPKYCHRSVFQGHPFASEKHSTEWREKGCLFSLHWSKVLNAFRLAWNLKFERVQIKFFN